jgi:PII-like signaling protein
MRIERDLCRLTVYTSEPRRHGVPSAASAALRAAAERRLSGGTLVAGFEGFGHGHHLHHPGILRRADELPLTLIIVDGRDRIDAFLPTLRELLPAAMMVIDPVRAIRYIRPHQH